MANLMRREPRAGESTDLFDRFDRMFDEWTRELPFRWPLFAGREASSAMIPVDEFQDGGDLVVRAELPGVDPEKDVEVTVADHSLHIKAERREEDTVKDKGYVRREVRYGTLSRTLPLPEGVSESDINANYRDGVLEIRIPTPQGEAARKIPIAKT
ncbi:MAG TPA: Hsp20/alpha crystallin family protein [Acidimicrobiales bacterium]|nr:Hsp20/alpha crystallin family protein [Acidimicrobiales bacterium]